MIALSMLAAGANAACTADDVTDMTACAKKVTDEMTKTAPTKDTICKLYQDTMACYPSCYCSDDIYKDSLKAVEDGLQTGLKAMGVEDCTLKCGSGSMLAPGMALALTVFAATYSQYE